MAEGIIEESTSAWAAPILVVPKPNGTGRLCVEFRRLSAVTVPDPFPMLCINPMLDRVGGAVFKRNTVRPRQLKVDALFDFPTVTNWKPVQSLLSLAGYYGKCQPCCADIMLSLTKLLKSGLLQQTQRFWTYNPDMCLASYANHPNMSLYYVWLLKFR